MKASNAFEYSSLKIHSSQVVINHAVEVFVILIDSIYELLEMLVLKGIYLGTLAQYVKKLKKKKN